MARGINGAEVIAKVLELIQEDEREELDDFLQGLIMDDEVVENLARDESLWDQFADSFSQFTDLGTSQRYYTTVWREQETGASLASEDFIRDEVPARDQDFSAGQRRMLSNRMDEAISHFLAYESRNKTLIGLAAAAWVDFKRGAYRKAMLTATNLLANRQFTSSPNIKGIIARLYYIVGACEDQSRSYNLAMHALLASWDSKPSKETRKLLLEYDMKFERMICAHGPGSVEINELLMLLLIRVASCPGGKAPGCLLATEVYGIRLAIDTATDFALTQWWQLLQVMGTNSAESILVYGLATRAASGLSLSPQLVDVIVKDVTLSKFKEVQDLDSASSDEHPGSLEYDRIDAFTRFGVFDALVDLREIHPENKDSTRKVDAIFGMVMSQGRAPELLRFLRHRSGLDNLKRTLIITQIMLRERPWEIDTANHRDFVRALITNLAVSAEATKSYFQGYKGATAELHYSILMANIRGLTGLFLPTQALAREVFDTGIFEVLMGLLEDATAFLPARTEPSPGLLPDALEFPGIRTAVAELLLAMASDFRPARHFFDWKHVSDALRAAGEEPDLNNPGLGAAAATLQKLIMEDWVPLTWHSSDEEISFREAEGLHVLPAT